MRNTSITSSQVGIKSPIFENIKIPLKTSRGLQLPFFYFSTDLVGKVLSVARFEPGFHISKGDALVLEQHEGMIEEVARFINEFLPITIF